MDALAEETAILVRLLQEDQPSVLDLDDRRDLRKEMALVRGSLERLESERRRLEGEARALGRGEFPDVTRTRCRDHEALRQAFRARELLESWISARVSGWRRRVRDTLWHEALLLEVARLNDEHQRLLEQRRA
jgi:hypothetical protein